MKNNKNSKALETYKIFPYVAWGLTIGFSFFVYNITAELKDTVDDLKESTDYLQQQVNTPIREIADFDDTTNLNK